jgi:hypothetical protein
MVTSQWAVCDKFIEKTDLDVFSCKGNHNAWWEAPPKQDKCMEFLMLSSALKCHTGITVSL